MALRWVWLHQIRNSQEIDLDTDASVVVILLSYKRMHNIDPIARSILKCRFVKKIIISNNNPKVDIHQWVSIKDPRINLINQPAKMPPGLRWFLAWKEPSDYYIAIDDDLLIYPRQLRGLFDRLIKQPDIPHGLFGSRLKLHGQQKGKKLRRIFFKRREMDVDILHSIYGVTKNHVNNILNYLDWLKENVVIRNDIFYDKTYKMLSVGDDILTSYSGLGRPKIHDTGRLVFCQTANDTGISVHQRERFFERRLKIIEAVEEIQSN